MSLYDFLHNFFGSNHEGKGRPPEFESSGNFWFNNPNGPERNNIFEDNDKESFPPTFDFRMMTDPFEMHRFFEQKVNEMMKSFVPPEGLPGFQGFGFEPTDVPALTEKNDPRDHYLKPGSKKLRPSGEKSEEERSDATTWQGKLIPIPDQEGKPMQPKIFSSFKSVIRKSVTLPDGTVKTEEIIRNSDGTEERTESHSKSDGTNTPFSDFPFFGPDFSDLFNPPKVPTVKDPRYQFLKPGYEKFNPYSEKVDNDLDKQIEQSGIESLPPFTKEPEYVSPNMNTSIKSFTRRTVTLPNGVVESEEIIRSPDGTEQRTVTHTMPDGSKKAATDSVVTGENKDPLIEGYDKPALSFALRGVKDFIDILFK